MDYVTIFGSCRQIPINNYLNVSPILDGLNYPHYTKEILQEIRYLKYKNIPNILTKYCFRSGLLSGCTKEISDLEFHYLNNEFNNTTFFLIEIASRITYKWNNLYLHHIAEDKKYNFTNINEITKEESTDEEIENDIIQIRNELYPKPFIIITHFATYTTGKRYELIKLLENICQKYNIPYINQSNIIKEKGLDILINEPVLAHYTSEGGKYIGKVLYDKINEVKQQCLQKNIYQVYYTSIDRVKKYTFHGFGDYIRGVFFLFQLFKNTNIDLKINFSNHSLSNFFICDNHLSIKECEEVKYIFEENANFLNYKHVFTNKIPITNISKECKDFVIKNCLTPNIYFEKKLVSIKKILNIYDYEYSIIHIRLNDNETFNHNRLDNIINIINEIHNSNKNEKFILISSSEIYLSYINFPFIIKTDLNRGHVGLPETTTKECEDTMIEFMIMKTSRIIYQLSVYSWGSGFSDIINKIYDVQINKISI